MSFPVFDHEQPAAEKNTGKIRTLTQGDHQFSFGIWNRQAKRYEPEPHYIPEGMLTEDDLRAKMEEVLFQNLKLQEAMKSVQGHILSNMEKMIEREKKVWDVERTKLTQEIDRMNVRIQELEAEVTNTEVKLIKTTEDYRTAVAQVAVYERSIKKLQDGKPEKKHVT